MNKKEFKKNMQQGLGRCVIALQTSNNIEKYKDIVLWGCLHDLSYDTQCEGTRADYVYKLTTFFNDENYFLMPTIEAFFKAPKYFDWKFSHFCELLTKFAENGNIATKEALQKKYDQLLSALLKKRRFGVVNYDLDCFEQMAVTLFSIYGMDVLLKIISDIGLLIVENPHYDCRDFEWFLLTLKRSLGEKRLNRILKRESKKSENIRCFYEDYLDSIKEKQNFVKSPTKAPNTEDIINEASSTGELSVISKVRFSDQAEDTEKIKLAKEIISTVDLDVKADLLSTFSFLEENFPFSHATIIEYSKSPHKELSEEAFEVLTYCQSKEVKEYALTLLADEKHKLHAIEMLLCNYTSDLKNLLLSELYKIKIDYKEKFDWHNLNLKILDVCQQGIKLPKEFFLYIYNTTLCSCCRECAVRRLSKHHWLTQDIIEECRYDSYSDISEFINRYYPAK